MSKKSIALFIFKIKEKTNTPVSWSVVTAAVKPTPDDPRPVVGIALGAVCNTYLKKCNKELIEAFSVFMA